jgi:nicotinate phosphoribosyltransferase
VLSILNHDTAIASAASRLTTAAVGRPCIELGSWRTHEESAVAAARAAYIAGFDATSNLEAGRRYGVPTTGTAAHAFTLLYDSEKAAFTAQVDALGKGTTLLVDTYDVRTAVALAMDIAGPELGAVRLDSGDLLMQATEVRAQLDAAGNTDTRIIVTSDLDEYAIAGLAAGPVSGYGVGTALVTGSGAPTASMVYKLVQREDASGRMEGVAKKSKDKASVGGRKWAMRRLDDSGVAQAEVIGIGEQPRDDGNDRPLMIDLVRAGEVVDHQDIHEARARHEASRAELPRAAAQLSRGEPVIPTIYEED